MSGYQETLTDPSYHRQVVVSDGPARRQHRRQRRGPRVLAHLGVRVRRPRPRAPSSNWRAQRSLDEELVKHGGSASPASTPAPSPATCANAVRCGSASSPARPSPTTPRCSPRSATRPR
ncbi:carbamoyl-phosphate synthase domain-containing protein [Yinghuangia aomiensis]